MTVEQAIAIIRAHAVGHADMSVEIRHVPEVLHTLNRVQQDMMIMTQVALAESFSMLADLLEAAL